MQIKNLEALPLANKLSLLEQITNSILKDENEYKSPAWHAKVLSARAEELNKSEEWLDLEEVIKEFAE